MACGQRKSNVSRSGKQDEGELARLRTDPIYREALAGLTGEGQVTGEITESVLLHALLRIGLTAVDSAAQQAGYDELAGHYSTDDQRRIARRRAPSWAGD